MRLQDIMNRSVETVAPSDSLVMANELMWRKRIHHLVVLEGSRVVGVISDTDLGGPNAQDIPDDRKVSDFMTASVVSGKPEMTVDRAINIFRERRLNCLPVLEGEKLVGIVTSSDIENLAKRGTSNRRYTGESIGPYPPLNPIRDND
ncbi:MAG: acetoin dehydrogenase [Vampirovibrio sp.]|jgi:acetoin utilization protein AcuB|nr:acetoin dehydrogenase [Vampirovibrio sp.]